jgi:putative hemolysin
MNTAKLVAFGALLSTLVACSFESEPVGDDTQTPESNQDPAMPAITGANPATAYCVSLGYEAQGDRCVFTDGTECEQWAFYRGQCGEAHSFCGQQGGTVSSVTKDMGTWTAEYAVCTLPDGTQCMEEAFALTGKCVDAAEDACKPLPAVAGGANPAAAYCQAMGYAIEGEQCVLPDGAECEQWAFYRGECGQTHSFCNQHGGTVSSVMKDMGTWTAVVAVCTLPNGKQCEEDAFARTCQCE